MLKRPAVGAGMVRVEEEEGEDLDDDAALDDDDDDEEEEEEEEEDDDDGEGRSGNQEGSAADKRGAAGQGGALRPRLRPEQAPPPQALPSALLGRGAGLGGRRLGRRASSVLPEYGKPAAAAAAAHAAPAVSGPDGAAARDARLQPLFLKERSATVVDLAGRSRRGSVAADRVQDASLGGGAAASLAPVAQSKARSFLLGVLAKARAPSGGSGSGSSGGGGAGSGSGAGGAGSGGRLACATSIGAMTESLRAPSSRRLGRALSPLARGWEDAQGSPPAGEPQAQAQTAREMVAALRDCRQQLPAQFSALLRVCRRLEALDAADARHALLCAALVDAGLLAEAAAVMREFRFHVCLHICAVNVLSRLASASGVYAFMMTELGIDAMLRKSVAVHAAHGRLVILASALLHAMEESATAENVLTARGARTAKDAQRATFFADLARAQLGRSAATDKEVAVGAAEEEKQQQQQQPRDPPPLRRLAPAKGSASASAKPPRHSASRLRQALAERLAPPPKLSARYALVAARSRSPSPSPTREANAAAPAPTTRVAAAVAAGGGLVDDARAGAARSRLRVRPGTSPASRSAALALAAPSSARAAAAAYGDRVVLVEPSPLAKRLPRRAGALSAGSARRRRTSSRLGSLTARAAARRGDAAGERGEGGEEEEDEYADDEFCPVDEQDAAELRRAESDSELMDVVLAAKDAASLGAKAAVAARSASPARGARRLLLSSPLAPRKLRAVGEARLAQSAAAAGALDEALELLRLGRPHEASRMMREALARGEGGDGRARGTHGAPRADAHATQSEQSD